MAASCDLTTLAKAKLFLRIPTSDTEDDTWLGQLIDQASQALETYCGRKFKFQQYTEYFDGAECGGGDETAGDIILVRNPPIQTSTVGTLVRTQTHIDSFVSVWDDLNYAWGSDTAIDTGNLAVRAEIGAIEVQAGLTVGTGNVKVQYYGGYDENALPGDLEIAANRMVAFLYNQARMASDGVLRAGEAGISATPDPSGIPANVRALLAEYVRGGW